MGVSCLLHAGWIDESQAIFIPPKLKEVSLVPEEFPIFWKGIFLAEAKHSEELAGLCSKLARPDFAPFISEAYCDLKNVKFGQQLKDWIRDYPLRQPLPTHKDFIAKARDGVSLATLPGTPNAIVEVLQTDPFGTSSEFLKIKSSANLFKFSSGDGVFLNKNKEVAFVPITFNFSPKDFKKTDEFLSLIRKECSEGCAHVELTGPHAASVRNRKRVMDDLGLVTTLGLGLLGLLIFMLGKRNGLGLFLLALPLTFTVALSIGATIFAFGSIHGLTLSFGPALVGLAADYGIYASVHRSSAASWRANQMGMLTTLAGLFVLSLSQVPLIRQLMFFAIVGLVLAFIFYRILMKSQRYSVFLDEIKVTNKFWTLGTWTSGALLLSCFALWYFVPIDLNLRNFEYRTPLQGKLENSFWESQDNLYPTFLVHKAGVPLNILKQEIDWSKSKNIIVDSVGLYLPNQDKSPLISWQKDCARNIQFSESSLKEFYKPFDASNFCNKLPKESGFPTYVSHLKSASGSILTFWLASSVSQETEILKEYPGAYSLRKLVISFPEMLASELAWMFPLTLALCLILLAIHYRHLKRQRFKAAFLALVPLMTSIGLILVCLTILQRGFSFVSLVAMLMVFGAGVDYGIFRVDQILIDEDGEYYRRTRTALILTGTTTLFGYFPMAIGSHPVLNNLGIVLSAGVTGAYIGCVWGVPLVGKALRLRNRV